MATTVRLLCLFIVPISCFNVERHLDMWCQEPLKYLNFKSINAYPNLEWYKKELEYRCAIGVRHIPKKIWTANLTELFRQPLKSRLKVLKISDGLQISDENFFTLESKLKYLDLSGNDLDYLRMPEVEPSEIMFSSTFHNLYALDLSKNKFTNLSFIKTNMTKLKELDISENRFQEVPLGSLLHFENLQVLLLKKNNITTFQNTNMKYSNINYLDLSYNHLVDLSGCEQLVKLKVLIVSNNNIEIIDANFFKGDIWSLGELHLDHNNISEITEDAFKYFPNLEKLILDNNRIVKLQTGVFSHLERLETLDVSHNLITSLDGTLYLKKKKLAVLNLNNNLIETLNYTYLVHLCPSLGEINILENHFRCNFLESMLSFFSRKNIFSPGGFDCLQEYREICCKTEAATATISRSDGYNETAMEFASRQVDASYWVHNEISYNMSKFVSSMEERTNALLKISIYQFAFIASVVLLVFVIYAYGQYEKKNVESDFKSAEMHKMI
ncbi:leucine-rich repeats and immunoglobulin-like domains protein 1 isoform X1 [Harmonia axyridis]|uniref:leucine-rich repeats and immunoglobulin-like domains protein 1 isoform X1 n=1 Tax=Harmonia axyridis TaxID=115357 RepID=UPI001E2760F1|nr:leucine-rich repeats and immunoglobulin-like domains protein 1 isoform X1 [Harmonia axyridis]